jgi:very-short-patch-repair endonuclease
MINSEIAKVMGRTVHSIKSKGYCLGLKKSEELLSQISKMGHTVRIKCGGRDLSKDNLARIAKGYNSLTEFYRGDSSAYSKALKFGIIDSICGHMTVMKYSTPQLTLRNILDAILKLESNYNDRVTIKPYEIDIYYPSLKLAFEYQGKYWHTNKSNNDTKKSDIMKQMGIKLICLYERGINYEADIKGDLLEHLDIINSVLEVPITESDVLTHKLTNVYEGLFNTNNLFDIAKGYQTLSKFRKSDLVVYRKLEKLGLLDSATSHMKNKQLKVKISDDELISIINQYDNLTDFRFNHIRLYKHIMRVGKKLLISHLKSKPLFTIDIIIDTINRYHTKCKFSIDNPKMYKFIRRNGLTHLLSGLDNCR